jgi:hypothetical protein
MSSKTYCPENDEVCEAEFKRFYFKSKSEEEGFTFHCANAGCHGIATDFDGDTTSCKTCRGKDFCPLCTRNDRGFKYVEITLDPNYFDEDKCDTPYECVECLECFEKPGESVEGWLSKKEQTRFASGQTANSSKNSRQEIIDEQRKRDREYIEECEERVKKQKTK